MTKINSCCNIYYAASKFDMLGLSCQPMGLMLKNYIYQKRKAMKKNMGNIDRIVRVVIAAIFVVLFFTNVVFPTCLGPTIPITGKCFINFSICFFCNLSIIIEYFPCNLNKQLHKLHEY